MGAQQFLKKKQDIDYLFSQSFLFRVSLGTFFWQCRFSMAYNSWILDFRICLRHLIVDLEILIMSPSFDNFLFNIGQTCQNFKLKKINNKGQWMWWVLLEWGPFIDFDQTSFLHISPIIEKFLFHYFHE